MLGRTKKRKDEIAELIEDVGEKMKIKTHGLIVAVIIVSVMMFVGCVEEEQKQVNKYSNLEIKKVSYESSQVKVIGTTDLPDGAEIILRIITPDKFYSPQDANVINGSFTMVFGPFQDNYDFEKESYKITASCLVTSQPNFVKKLIGENGEHLTGDLVTDSAYGIMLYTEQKFNGYS